MKKYVLLKKSTESSNQSPPHGAERSQSTSPEPYTTKEEQEALLQKAKSVEPPLPAAPPPVHDIDPNLQPKQEIDLHDYENNNDTTTETLTEQNNVSFMSNYEGESNQRLKPTICRDFIRGTCIRGAICKFAHECDLSQLEGVYKFCRNFQNAVCVLPYCRYVHATVFEEQRFYRTGILPPRAFSHHKKPIVLPPPPPPPEEPPPQEHVFTKPTTRAPRVDKTPPKNQPKQIIKCVPTASLEARPAETVTIGLSAGGTPPRDRDINTKKCDNCDTMEFRLQFNKDKTENMKRTTEDLKSKLDILTAKTHTLYSVLLKLMKLQSSKLRPEGLNGLSTLLSSLNKSEKEIADLSLDS